MSNLTVVADPGPLGLSTATLSASILGALLFALVLYHQTRGKTASEPVKVPAKAKEDKPEIQSLDGFDWKAENRNEFRPFKPIYHITMGAFFSLPIPPPTHPPTTPPRLVVPRHPRRLVQLNNFSPPCSLVITPAPCTPPLLTT
jgi:hypothetical protein